MRRSNSRRVFLGLDPGIRSIGYGLIESRQGTVRLLDAGLLVPQARASTYRDVAAALEALIARWRPAAVGIESIIFARNAKTAIGVAEMTGVLKFVVEQARIPSREFSPPEIKRAVTGSGTASKAVLGRMVAAILGIRTPPTPHHAADALAAALAVERSVALTARLHQQSNQRG